jgi:hypothetical protein
MAGYKSMIVNRKKIFIIINKYFLPLLGTCFHQAGKQRLANTKKAKFRLMEQSIQILVIKCLKKKMK